MGSLDYIYGFNDNTSGCTCTDFNFKMFAESKHEYRKLMLAILRRAFKSVRF